MKILGIDPGYGITGWGVVEEKDGTRLIASAYGCIETHKDDPIPIRLHQIHTSIIEIINEFSPQAVSVEKLFFSRNQTTAASVYEARGVVLAAAGSKGLPVIELTPASIKRSVTGSGRADKKDVTGMVMRLLNIKKSISPDDTADALAGAIAGIFQFRSDLITERYEYKEI